MIQDVCPTPRVVNTHTIIGEFDRENDETMLRTIVMRHYTEV